jgi:dihydroorotate dehydrogenase (fumarate)
MPFPPIQLPLINSANPWATTEEDLQRLFDCPHTGDVTIRTSLLDGFGHDDATHQYTFFDPQSHGNSKAERLRDGEVPEKFGGSLNTLGILYIHFHLSLSRVSGFAYV